MSRDIDLNILRQGVSAWNEWRRINPDIVPDLVGAELAGAELRGVNLIRANLVGAKLRHADLAGAELCEADLEIAELDGAYLSRANLFKANLSKAVLQGSILREADLCRANIERANLAGADLGNANLYHANLSGARLRWANLEGANLVGAIMPNGSIPKPQDQDNSKRLLTLGAPSDRAPRPERGTGLKASSEEGLPPDIQDFAQPVLACPGCAPLLHHFASHPHVSITAIDLAYELGESEYNVQQALEVLRKQDVVRPLSMGGETCYLLTQDQGTLARISEFLDWRERWIESAQRVIQNLDAEEFTHV